nr:hypothetical protein Q903MT_gene881 [Picea sitchensis]
MGNFSSPSYWLWGPFTRAYLSYRKFRKRCEAACPRKGGQGMWKNQIHLFAPMDCVWEYPSNPSTKWMRL